MDRHACSNVLCTTIPVQWNGYYGATMYVTTEISYSRTGAPAARSNVSINGIFRAIFPSTLMHMGTSTLPQACRACRAIFSSMFNAHRDIDTTVGLSLYH